MLLYLQYELHQLINSLSLTTYKMLLHFQYELNQLLYYLSNLFYIYIAFNKILFTFLECVGDVK